MVRIRSATNSDVSRCVEIYDYIMYNSELFHKLSLPGRRFEVRLNCLGEGGEG